MDFQSENQFKQYERQRLLAPARLQYTYNKENIEIQHKYNLAFHYIGQDN